MISIVIATSPKPPKPPMAATGKKDTTPSEIEELAKVLEGRAEKLRTYANIIRTRKLKTIPLSNRPMADRGVKQVDGYLLKIQAELGLV